MRGRGTVIIVASIFAITGGTWLYNYWEAQSWLLEIRTPAPIYETDEYPYGSQSSLNRVVGYLKPGEKPDVISMGYGKDWPYWKVRLPSGERGYLFAPDVDFKRKGWQ
jgi:hypothetical protein